MSLVSDRMQIISEQLMSCPLCKVRTQLEVYKKGFLSESFRIRCPACEAEWVYTRKSTLKPIPKTPFQAFQAGWEYATKKTEGKTFAETFPEYDIINDDSIWVLRKPDRNQSGAQFLEKKIDFLTWKQMTYTLETFCVNCRAPLAANTEFCPRCGVKTI